MIYNDAQKDSKLIDCLNEEKITQLRISIASITGNIINGILMTLTYYGQPNLVLVIICWLLILVPMALRHVPLEELIRHCCYQCNCGERCCNRLILLLLGVHSIRRLDNQENQQTTSNGEVKETV